MCRCELSKHAPIRALPLEHLIEIQDIQYPCAFEASGCSVLNSWGTKKDAHEAQCSYRKVRCPHSTIFASSCTAMLKLEDIPRHCTSEHGGRSGEGDTLKVGLTRSVAQRLINWPLSFLNNNFVLIASCSNSDLIVYARHIRGEPIRYRVSVSGNGFESSYAGSTEPLDQAVNFEIEHSKFLAIHNKMIPNISKEQADGGDSIRTYVTAEILS